MIKRALYNKGMWLACLMQIFIVYYEWFIAENFLEIILRKEEFTGNGLTIFLNVYALSIYVVFPGMFPALPYGFSFLEERNSGYLRYILQRMPAKQYICKKIFVTGISGAVTILIPYLLFVVPLFILTRENVDVLASGLDNLFWAELALFLTMYIRNKYIAFVLPFVVFQLFWLLFPWTDWNPVYLIQSNFEIGEIPIGQPFFVFIFYTVLVVIGILLSFRHQLKQEKL